MPINRKMPIYRILIFPLEASRKIKPAGQWCPRPMWWKRWWRSPGIIFLLELFFVAETQRKNTYFTFVMKETNKTLQLTRAVQSEQVLALDRVAKAEIKVQAFILGGKDGWLQIHFTSWTNILSNFDKYNLHFWRMKEQPKQMSSVWKDGRQHKDSTNSWYTWRLLSGNYDPEHTLFLLFQSLSNSYLRWFSQPSWLQTYKYISNMQRAAASNLVHKRLCNAACFTVWAPKGREGQS